MPTYEYRCKKGHNFEVLQRFTDDPISECEVCGLPVQRVFHPVAVHFKGSGFYNTDYGTRKRSREKEAAARSEKDSSSKETKKTESSSSDSSGSNGSGSSNSSNGSSSSNGSTSKSDKPAKTPSAKD